MPPPWTFGQEMFSSSQPTCSHASNFSATAMYSSVEKPQMFATIGLWKIFAISGISRAITASMPGFWSPTELSIPSLPSAMRGAGFPSRGCSVVPLQEKLPRQSRS